MTNLGIGHFCSRVKEDKILIFEETPLPYVDHGGSHESPKWRVKCCSFRMFFKAYRRRYRAVSSAACRSSHFIESGLYPRSTLARSVSTVTSLNHGIFRACLGPRKLRHSTRPSDDAVSSGPGPALYLQSTDSIPAEHRQR